MSPGVRGGRSGLANHLGEKVCTVILNAFESDLGHPIAVTAREVEQGVDAPAPQEAGEVLSESGCLLERRAGAGNGLGSTPEAFVVRVPEDLVRCEGLAASGPPREVIGIEVDRLPAISHDLNVVRQDHDAQ